ncbi:SCO family protein [Bradyrhizobium sp. 157]|nr:SCO family protein [Bradyrhizobium sp. 157]MCK1643066.1 SCO family protein [Bradyrhizobium sp. 157]
MRRRSIFSDLGRAIPFGIAVATALVLSQPLVGAANLPVTIGGPFTLTSPEGTAVTEQTYRGQWLLVYFGFTSCPDSCPTALLEISATLEKLGPDADKLQPLFITVDPQRDTPTVMGNYTQSFDSKIVGLTGTPQQIAAVAQDYGVYYAPRKNGPGADDYVMDHSTYLYLMDAEGKFVRGFDADTPGERIAEAVRSAIAKARENASHQGRPTQ